MRTVRKKGLVIVKKTLKSILQMCAGVLGGIAVAQALMVTAGRPEGMVGGEAIIPLAIPLLVAAGYWIGRDTPRVEDYDRGYAEGRRQGAIDQQQAMLKPIINCRHTVHPYDCEEDISGL